MPIELKYRPEIDGLRAIAVISVLTYHAEFFFGSQQLLKGGFVGVDVFFVISGYLITSLIISEHLRTGRFSLFDFYERRVRRLLPALLTVILFSLPFAWKHLLPSQLIDFSKSLIASIFFSSNFYWLITMQEYGAEPGLYKPFLHTWTLAVEEQYYIFYPLLLLGIYRWMRHRAMMALIIGLLFCVIYAEWITPRSPVFSFYMLPSRFWELLVGGLLANAMHRQPQKIDHPWLSRTMPSVGLGLIACSIIFTDFDVYNPGFLTWIPVIGTVFIIRFSGKGHLITQILSSRWFVNIGLISYSLYLWHYPIFAFGRILDPEPSLSNKFEWIILTLALATITYFLIERPFRRKTRVSGRALVGVLLGAVFAICVFSVYVIQKDGVRDRFPLYTKIYGKNEIDNEILRKRSFGILNAMAESQGFAHSTDQVPSDFEKSALWFSENGETHKVLIIGDSHSKDLFNALYQNRQNFRDYEFSRFAMNSEIPEGHVNELIDSRNFHASNIVMLSFRYGPENIQKLPALIKTIQEKNKKLIITSRSVEFQNVGNRPIFDWYVMKHRKAPNFSIEEVNRIFFSKCNLEHINAINRQVKAIADEYDVQFLNKLDYLCNDALKSCSGITPDGYKSFYDDEHYTLEGAAYFGSRIRELNWLGN